MSNWLDSYGAGLLRFYGTIALIFFQKNHTISDI